MDDSEDIGTPRVVRDTEELKALWRVLKQTKATREVVSDWTRYLPAKYPNILESDVLQWLWKINPTVIPYAIEGEVIDMVVETSLYSLYIIKCRARAHGMKVSKYADTYLSTSSYINSGYTINDEESFFDLDSDGKCFIYTQEGELILKLTMVNMGRNCSSSKPHSPTIMRYLLSKWKSGEYTTYYEEATNLLKYAASLVLYFYKKVYSVELGSIDYYSSIKNIRWSKGSHFAPPELKREVDALIGNLGEGLCLSPNSEFLCNYYRVASKHILWKLHNRLSKATIRRANEQCSIQ